MNVGDALNSRIENRIGDLLDKYFEGGYSGAVVTASEDENGAYDIVERTENPEFLPEGESDFAGGVDCSMIFGAGVSAALAAGPE